MSDDITVYEPPDHMGALAANIVPGFNATCGLCGREEFTDFTPADLACAALLKQGWRRDTDGRVLCPVCANLPGPKRRRGETA